jgi:hypothetical protein
MQARNEQRREAAAINRGREVSQKEGKKERKKEGEKKKRLSEL